MRSEKAGGKELFHLGLGRFLHLHHDIRCNFIREFIIVLVYLIFHYFLFSDLLILVFIFLHFDEQTLFSFFLRLLPILRQNGKSNYSLFRVDDFLRFLVNAYHL